MFIFIAVLLAVDVFDSDVMGVPCEGALCECDHNLKFVFYCANEQQYPGICVYETENVLRLYFHSSFRNVYSDYRFIRL